MISRFARLSVAGLLVVNAFAQAPAPLPQNPPNSAPPVRPVAPPQNPARPASLPGAATPVDDEPVTLKLPDADIDTILSTLETLTGKIILRPSQLPTAPGGYNLRINRQVPKSQAILYLETILAMNNIAVIPMGNDALKVVQLPQARVEAPELIEGSTLNMPPSSKVASKLFQLDFLRVQEFQQMLGTITNPNFGQTVPLANANAILITDTISNLQRIETLLQQVDKPVMAGLAPKFYTLHYAKASDLVGKLRTILTGAVQQQLGQITTYNADDRTNQVVLITDPRQFPFFDDLISKLDVKSDPNTRNDVIYLKHAKAADVVQVLVRIIQGQSQINQRSQSARPNQTTLQPNTPTPPSPLGQPAAAPQPTVISGSGSANPSLDQGGTNEFSSLVTVVNDDRSNSIVVSGTLDDIRLMQELVDKLDIVLAQVRIEVVMAEVTLTDNSQSGISQLGLQIDGDKLTGFSLTGGGSGSPITIGGVGNATMATITRNNGNIDLAGLISLGTEPRHSNTTILTVPAIVTSHGKQAVITDGQTVPIITGSTSYASSAVPGTTTSSITQQQVGTTLTVTPFIGGDGSVQLDIQVELTNLGDQVTIDNNTQYKIGTRKTTSYVTARNGDIIVMGGFRQDQDQRSRNRLGGIPIIGDILGSRQKTKTHQELIFFIRPTVLTNDAAVDNAETMKQVDKLPSRDEIHQTLDPKFQPPKKSLLDKILPR